MNNYGKLQKEIEEKGIQILLFTNQNQTLGDMIIQKLQLEDIAVNNRSFFYIGTKLKFIFVRPQNSEEMQKLIEHEYAHIKLHHNQNLSDFNCKQEKEAEMLTKKFKKQFKKEENMFKKILTIFMAGALTISLCACGTTTQETQTETVEVPAAAEQGEYYFDGTTLVAEDVKIEITDVKILRAGESIDEFTTLENDCIAFWYTCTNLSGKEDISADISWIAMFEAYQDNNVDIVNKLEVSMFSPEPSLIDEQMAEIKKDGTAHGSIAYDLTDTTTPVLLKATRGVDGEPLGEKIFELN